MELFRKKDVGRIVAEAAQADAQTDAHGVSAGSLKRTLGTRDLVSLGIAAVIGAGIFSTIGNASANGGPAVSLLFIFTAIACAFSAMCYAEFASAIPIAGSAYTYAYASFGELVAWLIGWSLLLEYAVSNIAVAISWSGYFTALIESMGFHFPAWLTMDFLSASRGFAEVTEKLAAGASLNSLPPNLREAYAAWTTAPQIGGVHFVADVPALVIVGLITWLVYVGVKESKNTNNVLVVLKLAVVLLVIGLGAAFVDPDNWTPFAPNGFKGVLGGISAVFFAYIGFDSLSTMAEETKDPRRDLPRAMIWTLIICTILYVAIALILTGMTSYSNLAVDDPLAHVFSLVGLGDSARRTITSIIAVSAVVAMTSALLVYQMGQPRIWMSMSRDGLLPPIFSRIHPKYRTPGFSTILTGFVVAIPSLFLNLTEVTDLTSIGTLFAFVLVCAGVLHLQASGQPLNGKFKVPYVNAGIYVPIGFVVTLAAIAIWVPDSIRDMFVYGTGADDPGFVGRLPRYLFIIVTTLLTIQSIRKRYSLIPVLGVLSCLYLMTELHVGNWVRFAGWLGVGALIYFMYGYQHSKLRAEAKA